MLVLTRSAGEKIVIGHDVVVTVIEVRGDQVRIGIEAPRTTPIYREEVYTAIESANRAASSTDTARLRDLGRLKRRPGEAGQR